VLVCRSQEPGKGIALERMNLQSGRINEGAEVMTMTRDGVLLGLMLLVVFLATPAQAQVNINVHIGEPPPVVVYSPPTMVLLPEPETYVAVDVPYDIYFVSGRYYYLDGGHWFWGPGYAGPWTYVEFERLPPGLRKFKVKRLHEFREREYRGYKESGPNFRGTYFVAEEHPGHGKSKGKGKGKH
jgi:hypothetical protein